MYVELADASNAYKTITNADIKYLDNLRILGDAPGGRLRCLNTESKEVVLSGFWGNLKKFRNLAKYHPVALIGRYNPYTLAFQNRQKLFNLAKKYNPYSLAWQNRQGIFDAVKKYNPYSLAWQNRQGIFDAVKNYNPYSLAYNNVLKPVASNAFALNDEPEKQVVMLRDGTIVHNLSGFWRKIGNIGKQFTNWAATNPIVQAGLNFVPGGSAIAGGLNLINSRLNPQNQGGGDQGGGGYQGGQMPQMAPPQMPQMPPQQMPQMAPPPPQMEPQTPPPAPPPPAPGGFGSFLTSNTVAGMVIGAILIKTLSKP